MWRKLFIKNLIENNKSLKIMYDKYGFYPTLKLPTKLDTDEEIINFSREINDAIKFPEYAYLKNIKKK